MLKVKQENPSSRPATGTKPALQGGICLHSLKGTPTLHKDTQVSSLRARCICEMLKHPSLTRLLGFNYPHILVLKSPTSSMGGGGLVSFAPPSEPLYLG